MKQNRFYYSAKQHAIQSAYLNVDPYENPANTVWTGKEWVKYTEWCSNPEAHCNWEDAVLVYETDDTYPQFRAGESALCLDPPYELRCSNCGEVIPIGKPYYEIPGLIYKCCSKGCLLDAYTNYRVKMNTGEEED